MGSIFSPPKPPKIEPVTKEVTPPAPDDSQVQRKRREHEAAARRRHGRRASILTSGLGDKGPSQVRRKSLLGE